MIKTYNIGDYEIMLFYSGEYTFRLDDRGIDMDIAQEKIDEAMDDIMDRHYKGEHIDGVIKSIHTELNITYALEPTDIPNVLRMVTVTIIEMFNFKQYDTDAVTWVSNPPIRTYKYVDPVLMSFAIADAIDSIPKLDKDTAYGLGNDFFTYYIDFWKGKWEISGAMWDKDVVFTEVA